jgi:hypothetical protein
MVILLFPTEIKASKGNQVSQVLPVTYCYKSVFTMDWWLSVCPPLSSIKYPVAIPLIFCPVQKKATKILQHTV